MRFAKFVCSLRIRVENREMPVAAPSMQDRQPSLILRIEALGSDLAQRGGRCLGEPPQSTSSRRPIGGLVADRCSLKRGVSEGGIEALGLIGSKGMPMTISASSRKRNAG
jgi:hypothetical protein